MVPYVSFSNLAQLLLLLTVSVAAIQFVPVSTNLSYPKIIWTYWEGRVTAFVSSLMEETRKNISPDWTYIFLQPQNLSLYLNISAFPPSFYSLYPQIKSDYIRIALLNTFGGWWFDASTLVNSKAHIDELYNLAVQENADFLGYCNEQCTRNRWLETGVMYAPVGSQLLAAWRQQMNVMFTVGIRAYIYHVRRSGVSFLPAIMKNYPNITTYLAVFVCGTAAQERYIPRRTVLITYDIWTHIYKPFRDCRMQKDCIQNLMKNKTAVGMYPIMKFYKSARSFVDPQYKSVHRWYTDFAPMREGIDTLHTITPRIYHLLNTVFILAIVITLNCCV